jgi:hypothetical protein
MSTRGEVKSVIARWAVRRRPPSRPRSVWRDHSADAAHNQATGPSPDEFAFACVSTAAAPAIARRWPSAFQPRWCSADRAPCGLFRSVGGRAGHARRHACAYSLLVLTCAHKLLPVASRVLPAEIGVVGAAQRPRGPMTPQPRLTVCGDEALPRACRLPLAPARWPVFSCWRPAQRADRPVPPVSYLHDASRTPSRRPLARTRVVMRSLSRVARHPGNHGGRGRSGGGHHPGHDQPHRVQVGVCDCGVRWGRGGGGGAGSGAPQHPPPVPTRHRGRLRAQRSRHAVDCVRVCAARSTRTPPTTIVRATRRRRGGGSCV